MGESACLVRSFSHPSDASREAKEGDPIRALTESISFGRFMSESLAWEKWSTFSHNRYLEEVEKFSKPGSVAQKKAYFEAHYKKKAAMKAAALLEEANAGANKAPEMESTVQNIHKSSMDSELVEVNNHLAINEQQVKDSELEETSNHLDINVMSSESACSTESNASNSNVERKNVETAGVERAEASMEQDVNVYAPYAADVNACDHNVERDDLEIVEVGRDELVIEQNVNEDAPCAADVNACDHKVERDYLEIVEVQRGESVIEQNVNVVNSSLDEVLKQPENDEDNNVSIAATLDEKMPCRETVEEHLASSSKKRQAKFSHSRASKLSLPPAKREGSIQPRYGNNFEHNSQKSAGIDQRRSTPKSLHMSINFASPLRETSKPSLKLSKDGSTSLQTPTRASIITISKHPPMVGHSEDRRTKTLNKSISGVAADGKWHSLIVDHSKSSSPSGGKGRSRLVSTPFVFRSEERAAKRREFFLKLGEKSSANEAGKMTLQTRPKEKTEHHDRKMQQRTNFKAKPNGDPLRASQTLAATNHTKKIPPTQPRSPKLGKKPTPNTVPDRSSRPPRWPLVNPETSKPILQKNKQSTTHSVTSLPKKKNAHENSSPNIQV